MKKIIIPVIVVAAFAFAYPEMTGQARNFFKVTAIFAAMLIVPGIPHFIEGKDRGLIMYAYAAGFGYLAGSDFGGPFILGFAVTAVGGLILFLMLFALWESIWDSLAHDYGFIPPMKRHRLLREQEEERAKKEAYHARQQEFEKVWGEITLPVEGSETYEEDKDRWNAWCIEFGVEEDVIED